MKHRIPVLALIPLLIVAGAALAWSNGAEEEKQQDAAIKYNELPDAVRNALRRYTSIKGISEIERETSQGLSFYEIEYKGRGFESSVKPNSSNASTRGMLSPSSDANSSRPSYRSMPGPSDGVGRQESNEPWR